MPAISVKMVFSLLCAIFLVVGCFVKRKCFEDSECEPPKICKADGRCGYECETARDCCIGEQDCEERYACVSNRCKALPRQIECPPDMAPIRNSFCMDKFEASRPDATAETEGTDSSRAMSVKGVMPWVVESNAVAEAACNAASKVLCAPEDWEQACEGSTGRPYSYADSYNPFACNSVETFGGPEQAKVMPTGSFPACVSEWGIYDLSGNLWEHVRGGNATTVRGGSFSSPDPTTDHRCSYEPRTWIPCPCSIGFRCCKYPDPHTEEESADEPPAQDAETAADAGEGPTEVTYGAQDPSHEDFEVGSEALDGETEAPSSPCPSDMVKVGTFCIDAFEASRADATAEEIGTSSVPTSRPGVQPWTYTTLDEAREACLSVGKRLCTAEEWAQACSGRGTYPYGPVYDPDICNGIDTFCRCSSAACRTISECPYPGCFNTTSPEGGGPCGADPVIMPTGSFPDCHNGSGVFDMSGNVWELVDSPDGIERWRGGSYSSLPSAVEHRCDYVLETAPCPCARGFRCCKEAGN